MFVCENDVHLLYKYFINLRRIAVAAVMRTRVDDGMLQTCNAHQVITTKIRH